MIKFESQDTANLEICDTANKPIPLVLNRQMIKILEDMAVPNFWFFQEQNKELDRLRLITAQTCNTVAFLKRQKIADKLGLPQLIRCLERIGIDYKKDRFLCSVVEAVVLRELRLLKHKARIPIEEGATLFGIADEYGFLEEGEIYITFDQSAVVRSSYLDLDKCEMIVTRYVFRPGHAGWECEHESSRLARFTEPPHCILDLNHSNTPFEFLVANNLSATGLRHFIPVMSNLQSIAYRLRDIPYAP
jgi:hypothetical protein